MGVWHSYYQTALEGFIEAQRLFQIAVELDAEFPPAFAGIAHMMSNQTLLGGAEFEFDTALAAAERAVKLDTRDAVSHHALGLVHLNRGNKQEYIEAAITKFETAVSLNPNWPYGHHALSLGLIAAGRYQEAIPPIEFALRLSPRDPGTGRLYARLAGAHIGLEQYDIAADWAKKSVVFGNVMWSAYIYLVTALVKIKKMDEALSALEVLCRIQPDLTIKHIENPAGLVNLFYSPNVFVDALRKLGVPEK